jgi:hypothetical protein
VSSLWTPGGEHPVDRRGEPEVPEGRDPGDDELDDLEDLDEAEVRARLTEARERLREVPAAQVVANHAMGLWELAAIHLAAQPPALEEASLAIDAVGALVEGLGDRLGENGPVLRDALAQIRLAFVAVKGTGAPTAGGPY